MSDFAGMEDLLQDFLVEAGDLLSGVDNKLVDLERSPDDRGLLNDIFRGFHTIKGGAGFLNATELVTLCHLTESLFDKLRNGELRVTPERMDVILAATGAVRDMFTELERGTQPAAADAALLDSLRAAVSGNSTLLSAGDELCDMPLTHSLIHPEEQERAGHAFASVKSQQQPAAKLQCRMRTKQDSYTWTELTCSLFSETGTPAQFCVCLVEDITSKKEMENELRASEAQLRQISAHLLDLAEV